MVANDGVGIGSLAKKNSSFLWQLTLAAAIAVAVAASSCHMELGQRKLLPGSLTAGRKLKKITT